jgi:hypothetical protein
MPVSPASWTTTTTPKMTTRGLFFLAFVQGFILAVISMIHRVYGRYIYA